MDDPEYEYSYESTDPPGPALAQLSLLELRIVDFGGPPGCKGESDQCVGSQIACSVDQVSFLACCDRRSFAGPCFCDRIGASRTARSTATGTSSRTGAVPVARWCSGRCCIWVRSTTANMTIGAVRSKCLTRMRDATPSFGFFPADRGLPGQAEGYGVQVRLDAMELHRPRQWGACWLSCELYEQLGLDQFWARRLPALARGNELVRYPADAGVLPADRSRQRVASAPAMV